MAAPIVTWCNPALIDDLVQTFGAVSFNSVFVDAPFPWSCAGGADGNTPS
jgi:hypothetical protein